MKTSQRVTVLLTTVWLATQSAYAGLKEDLDTAVALCQSRDSELRKLGKEFIQRIEIDHSASAEYRELLDRAKSKCDDKRRPGTFQELQNGPTAGVDGKEAPDAVLVNPPRAPNASDIGGINNLVKPGVRGMEVVPDKQRMAE